MYAYKMYIFWQIKHVKVENMSTSPAANYTFRTSINTTLLRHVLQVNGGMFNDTPTRKLHRPLGIRQWYMNERSTKTLD